MSASDLAAVVVVIVATVAATLTVVAVWDLRRAAQQMRASARHLDHVAQDLSDELHALLGDARRLLTHAENNLERAGHVVEVIEQASKSTYRTVARPVIKVAAVASGVRRGAGWLRHGEDASGETSAENLP